VYFAQVQAATYLFSVFELSAVVEWTSLASQRKSRYQTLEIYRTLNSLAM